VIWRDGEKLELTTTLQSMPSTIEVVPVPMDSSTPLPLGLTLAPLTTENRLQFGVDEDVVGILITEVDNGSAAAQLGIQAGDVIVQVGRNVVSTRSDFTRHVGDVKAKGVNHVVLLIRHAGTEQFVVLPFD
jgi:serine protease Do